MTKHILVITLTLMFASLIQAAEYDVVIRNGRVIDVETGFDAVRNVGIKDGRIAVITSESISGNETIDASGRVVTAGFIDIEIHSQGPWGNKVNLRDGVTTQMDFELGALNISEWYAARRNKEQANYGTVIGQELARTRIHDGLALEGPNISMPNHSHRVEAGKDGLEGWSVTRSSIDQMNQITQILDEGLQQGALGVGSTVGYARKGITTLEMREAQKIAGRYGRVTSVHQRFHPSAVTPIETQTGLNELLVNAMTLKAPLHIHHDNDYGWWENEEKLAQAREQGYNVWASYYPWEAGSGPAGASILAPESWEKGMGYKYEETIYDPRNDKFLSKEGFLELRKSDPGYLLVVYSLPRLEWMSEWLKMPHFTVSSDAMPGIDSSGTPLSWDSDYEDYTGHPRTAGSHTRVLRMARETGVPLMHTLAQMSYWPAMHLGDTGLKAMQERGRMQEGMVADIVVFDAEKVTENATYKFGHSGLPSSGIPWVLVNGTVVVANAKVLEDVNPGQPIRFPVSDKGRFEPVPTGTTWQSAYDSRSGQQGESIKVSK